MPFTVVARFARKRQIKVNGIRAKINTRIAYNQKIITPIIEYQNPIQQAYVKPNNFKYIKEKIFNSIIYEDQHLILLDKPYNICVQDGSKVKISIDRIFKLSKLKLHIVHRIDKETTGLLLFAKNSFVAAKISELFREKRISNSSILNKSIRKFFYTSLKRS